MWPFTDGRSATELLRQANLKFENRFRRLEEIFAASGRKLDGASPEEFDRVWEEVKAAEKA